jgi:hypothetical protein
MNASFLLMRLACSLGFLLAVVSASVEDGTIVGRLQFPDSTHTFNQTTRITLNNDYTTYSRSDGGFTFYNVPSGIHVVDVQSTVYHFSQIKCQLLEGEQPKCLEYAYPGATKQPTTTWPVVLTAHATFDYFEKRAGFSIFGILKNPMVIMMVFSVGMMTLMPKMMENMEPEEKERVRQQMEMQKDPTKMLASLWGDLTTGGEDEKQVVKKSPQKKK